jgi:hypothetical protein
MKTTNKLLISAYILFFGFGTLVPQVVSAHPADALLHSYCTRLLVFEVGNSKKVMDIEVAYANREKTRLNELTAIRAKQDKEMAAFTEGYNAELETYFADMTAESKDQHTLDSLNVLRDQVTALSKKRDADIVQLRVAYRTGINDLIVARKAAFMTAKANFKGQVSKILAKSKADCENQVKVQDIFDYTTTSLKAAHEVFKGKIAQLGTSESKFKKLADERDISLKNANAAYLQGVKDALSAFKTQVQTGNITK